MLHTYIHKGRFLQDIINKFQNRDQTGIEIAIKSN